MQIYYTLKAMNIWSRGQVVKTPPFHGGIRGSSPLEITIKKPSNDLLGFLDEETTNKKEKCG